MSSKKNMFFCSYVLKILFLCHKNHVLSHRFLPILLEKPLFCATCMRIKDSLKHRIEKQMHSFLHLREQQEHAFEAFSEVLHRLIGGFTEVLCNIWNID